MHFPLEIPLKLLFAYYLSSPPDLALEDAKVSELSHSFVHPALGTVPGTLLELTALGQLNPAIFFLRS